MQKLKIILLELNTTNNKQCLLVALIANPLNSCEVSRKPLRAWSVLSISYCLTFAKLSNGHETSLTLLWLLTFLTYYFPSNPLCKLFFQSALNENRKPSCSKFELSFLISILFFFLKQLNLSPNFPSTVFEFRVCDVVIDFTSFNFRIHKFSSS